MVLQKKNTRCLCSHSLTQVLLTVITSLFGIAHLRSSSLSLSAFAHSVSHSWRTNNPSPYHSQLSKKRTDFIHEKGKKRQHPPSNTVYAEWSCALWWQSIYTWEEGNWYWDRSNIAANEGLLPGKLEKRWWTVEEIYEGLTIKNVEGKKTAENNSNCFPHGASLKCTGCLDMWAYWNNAWHKINFIHKGKKKKIVFISLLTIPTTKWILKSNHYMYTKNIQSFTKSKANI